MLLKFPGMSFLQSLPVACCACRELLAPVLFPQPGHGAAANGHSHCDRLPAVWPALADASEAQSEARLRAILDASPDCVLVAGRDGRLTEINPAGLEIFEAESIYDLAGTAVTEFVPEEHRGGMLCRGAVARGEM